MACIDYEHTAKQQKNNNSKCPQTDVSHSFVTIPF